MTKIKLLLVIFALITLGLMSFQLPKNIQKKVDKEIKLAFEIEEFQISAIRVSEEINSKLRTKISSENFYKIVNGSELMGYAFVDKAPSKTAQFDYLVLFDKNLIIKKAKVLVYREDYGGEIGSKRWLRQFIGKSKAEKLIYEKDIIAISGATISANSMTMAVNNLLKSIDTLHSHKII